MAITRSSNPVLVIVPTEPAFSIEKRQEIAGSGEGFTTSKLSGVLGQTVDYQIVVTNTGNVPLTLSKFTDSHCDTGTIKGGPGASSIAPKASTTYTCDHKLTAVGSYTNTATVTATGTPPECHGSQITHRSNTVEVKVSAAKPSFTIEQLQEIEGSTQGSRRRN